MSGSVSLRFWNRLIPGVWLLKDLWGLEMQQDLVGVSPAPQNQLPALRIFDFCNLAQKFAWNNSQPWCDHTD